jgi:hypothetical protein
MDVMAPKGFAVPDEEALLVKVQSGIRACRSAGLFADPPVTVIRCPTVIKADKDKKEEPISS